MQKPQKGFLPGATRIEALPSFLSGRLLVGVREPGLSQGGPGGA